MGLAVSSMHYTGMSAVSIQLSPGGAVLPGATATEFIFPLTVVLGSFLFLTSAFVALSPTAQQRRESESAVRRLHDVETERDQLGRQLEDVVSRAGRMEAAFSELEKRFHELGQELEAKRGGAGAN